MSDTSSENHLGTVAKRLIDRFLPEDTAPPIKKGLNRFLYALLGVVSTFLITFMFLVGQSFPADPVQPRPITDFIALIVTLGTDWRVAAGIGLVLAALCAAYALAVAHSLLRRGPLGLLLSGATLPSLLIALIRFGTR